MRLRRELSVSRQTRAVKADTGRLGVPLKRPCSSDYGTRHEARASCR